MDGAPTAQSAATFRVTGRVQGVYFRKNATARANELRLRGWITNEPDGAVVGTAAGAAPQLAELQAWLRRGPPRARVAGLEWAAATPADVPGAAFAVRES